jgi:hypothetical protein
VTIVAARRFLTAMLESSFDSLALNAKMCMTAPFTGFETLSTTSLAQ